MSKPKSLVSAYNPLRSPAWRYERILQLVEGRGRRPPLRTTDDAYVAEGRDFYLRWKGRSVRDRERLASQNPGLYYAFLVHEEGRLGKLFEAHILARESAQRIAHAYATLPATVDYYEKLFFDVRDRLDRPEWIVHQVLGPAVGSPEKPLSLGSHELTLKFFAYFGGPKLLAAALTGWLAYPRPEGPKAISGLFDQLMVDVIKRRSAEASLVFGISPRNVFQLFDLHARLVEIERTARSQGEAQTAIEANILAMMGELRAVTTVGQLEGEQHPTAPALVAFAPLAAELRDDELLEVAAGQGLPRESLEELTRLAIPDGAGKR